MSTTVRLPRIAQFPIEAGHIRLFARAIGDPNPIYSDPDYAARSTTGGVIAPPTFSEASNHFDEAWPFRPSWDFSSHDTHAHNPPAAASSGTDMHAETHFVYHQPLRPGMVLSVRARPGREWKKWGARSGELKFHEIVAEFIDADGRPALDCTTVVLRTSRTVTAPAEAATNVEDKTDRSTQPSFEQPPPTPEMQVGAKIERVLVRRLSRAHIAQYAGVAGDFSPQHVDEVYNTRVAGYRSVFAPGMLTMGMAGRVVTDLVGDGRLRKFGFRFRQQVWPEDSLFAAVEVTGIARNTVSSADLAITVTNQQGQVVGTGYAVANIED